MVKKLIGAVIVVVVVGGADRVRGLIGQRQKGIALRAGEAALSVPSLSVLS